MPSRIWLATAVVVALAPALIAAERTWTDVKGRSMQAEFIRELNGEATFIKDGKLVTVPLDQLSEADRKYIRDIESNGSAPDQPANDPPSGGLGGGPVTDRPGSGSRGESSDSRSESGSNGGKKTVAIVNRVWTDVFGNQTTGKYVRFFDGKVVISRTSGKLLTVAYYDLVPSDQEHVNDLLTSKGQESLIPPPLPIPRRMANDPLAANPDPTGGGAASFPNAPSRMPGPIGPGGARSLAEEARQRAEQQHQEFLAKIEQQKQERAQKDEERRQQLAERTQQAQQTHSPGGSQDAHQQSAEAMANTVVAKCPACKHDVLYSEIESGARPHCSAPWRVEHDAHGRPTRLLAGVPKNRNSPAAMLTSMRGVAPELTVMAFVIMIGVCLGIAAGLIFLVGMILAVLNASHRRAAVS